MSKTWVVAVVLLGCVFLASPVIGQSQTGACWRIDDLSAGCIPEVSEQECLDIYSWTEPVWNAGSDCFGLDLPFQWDGSCLGDLPDVGERCILLWHDVGDELTAVAHCESEDGIWFDNLNCEGAPVPTMPNAGMALMVFALVGITLLALTSRAS